MCKATFVLTPTLSPLADDQEGLYDADEHWDDDLLRSLHNASDLVPFKARPEVLVVGHAYAPGGSAVPSFLARLRVGSLEKSLLVVGDRHGGPGGALTEPSPIVRMPLRWERAAGGPGTLNPVGMRSGAAPDARGAHPLPNLLPVGTNLLRAADGIAPAGFAPLASGWPVRRARKMGPAALWNGVIDPGTPLPEGLDPAYFNAAPNDQWLSALTGEEIIVLSGLHPLHTELSTRLAPIRPRAHVELRNVRTQEVSLAADTLLIDTDRGIATLVFRGHLTLDHQNRDGRVVITLAAPISGTPFGPAEIVKDAPPTPRMARAFTDELTASADAAPPPGATLRMAVVEDAAAFDAETTVTQMPEWSDGQSGARPVVTGLFADEDTHDGAPPPRRPTPLPERHDDPDKTLNVRATAPAGPAWLGAIANPAPAEAPDTASAAALPFRRTAGAQVGGMALGRSMRLEPPRVSGPDMPVPTPPPVPPAPVSPPAPLPPPMAVPPPDVPWPELVPAKDPLNEGAPPEILPPENVRLEVAPFDIQPPPMVGPIAGHSAEPPPEPAEPLSAAPERRTPEPTSTAHTGIVVVEITAPQPLPLQDYPLERCAGIAARAALRSGPPAERLKPEGLEPPLWERLDAHYREEIQKETARGKSKLLKAYDAAYVAALEGARGPITVEEHARLVVAAERGETKEAAERLGLPAEAPMRIQRIWMKRVATDAQLAVRVRKAIAAERDA
jgi:hypothetical protein